MTTRQLHEAGYDKHAIAHRVRRGQLHPEHRGVYAVGRPDDSREGRWMAAVLAYEPDGVLSHHSAGCLWGFLRSEPEGTEVSLPSPDGRRKRPGIEVHRRSGLEPKDVTRRRGIPVTTVATTLIDVAPHVDLDAVVNEAVMGRLITLERLRDEVADVKRPGAGLVRALLERATFRLSRSKLERRFLPLARRATGITPQTLAIVDGFEVDFWFPELNVVVETDGGEFHRTPAQQTNDRRREHAHAEAGRYCLRFTHLQIARHPADVERTLASRRRPPPRAAPSTATRGRARAARA